MHQRMDAAVPADAQNAPTGTWKTAQTAVSHSAHTHHRQRALHTEILTLPKNALALKEARESRHWLRLARARERPLRPLAVTLITESSELIAIITTIIVKAKSNPDRGSNGV